jgi:hypothetical protein
MPIDHIEHHAAGEHFRFKVGGVLFSLGRFPHTKARLFSLTLQDIVSR